jgi:hypothetical protein
VKSSTSTLTFAAISRSSQRYDRVDLIPFDALATFFRSNLAQE